MSHGWLAWLCTPVRRHLDELLACTAVTEEVADRAIQLARRAVVPLTYEIKYPEKLKFAIFQLLKLNIQWTFTQMTYVVAS